MRTVKQDQIQMVPLRNVIETPQVRTKMDKVALEELAADMLTNGMLQAVIVRPIGGRKYRVIAGHRRIAAARIANLQSVPATVREADDDEALMMQLSENIHREDLSLIDTANAVRRLFDTLGTFDAVCAFTMKSKAWVSKHLAVTCPSFSWQAQQLLENDHTEDLELLNIVTQVNQVDHDATMPLVSEIKAGRATRDSARAYLREVKARSAQQKAALAVKTKQKLERAKLRPVIWNPDHALTDIYFGVLNTDELPAAILGEFTKDQIEQLEAILVHHHDTGSSELKAFDSDAAKPQEMQWALITRRIHLEKEDLRLYAYIAGVLDDPLPPIRQFLADVRDVCTKESA